MLRHHTLNIISNLKPEYGLGSHMIAINMGCVGTRNDLINAEKAIIEGERSLNFQLSKSAYVDLIMRKYSHNGRLNESQLKEVMSTLSLAANDDFFGHFKEENMWSLRWLDLLGILLSRGDAESKSSLMFQLFDPENTKEISQEQVRDLLECLWTISVSYLPLLAKEAGSKIVSVGEVTEYVSFLESHKEQTIEDLVSKFGSGNIGYEVFVGAFCQEELSPLVNPFGIRAFTKNLKLKTQ